MKGRIQAALALVLCLAANQLHAQTVRSGKVFGQQKESREMLPGAVIQMVAAPHTSVVANENGVFQIPLPDTGNQRLVVSAPGFETDTIDVAGKPYISLVIQALNEPERKTLTGVTVTGSRGSYLSSLSAAQTEIITRAELTKAACCDLAGCFGTQAAVQPQTTNVVTNAQELRILGLSGVYNQVLVDGLPLINGATYTYGISTYPGTLVENIFVAKGTTSVLQGFEVISGQINLVTRLPDKAERLFGNAYINSFGEKHFNAQAAVPVGRSKKWHSLLSLHTVQPAGRVDNNSDGFMDLPLLTRYMAFNKWQYRNEQQEGLSLKIGLRMVQEQRLGGQMDFDTETDAGTQTSYGQVIKFQQPEANMKVTYRFNSRQALHLALAGSLHDQQSWFGTTRYQANQKMGMALLQHELTWAGKHRFNWGLSYRYQHLNESIAFSGNSLGRTYAGDYQTLLNVPGIFAENAFHWKDDKILLITGARLDHHQQWGNYFTPRALLRWNLSSAHTLRASVGSGWRQVFLFPEQVNLLVSSRDLVFKESLKPEQAYNWGLNHVWRYRAGAFEGTVSSDFYSTHFQNQFFPDYDSDPTKVFIRNYEGPSRAIGSQLEATVVFRKRLEGRIAYNYLDVSRKENGVQTELPFNPRNRLMAAVSYRTANNRWQADANAHWFDRMRLPNTEKNPEAYRRPLFSTPYATLNVQGTFRWKTLELYGGCENVLDFTQPNPIISAENPFGPYFDISSVWGPTRGRELYLGMRWKWH